MSFMYYADAQRQRDQQMMAARNARWYFDHTLAPGWLDEVRSRVARARAFNRILVARKRSWAAPGPLSDRPFHKGYSA